MITRPLSLLLALCCLASATKCFAQKPDQPNIVLIYTDDVGYADVSCNGQTTLMTPHIDSLARDGLRMTDAHCSAATCTPSRFAMLTGQYAFRQKGTGIARGNAPMVIQPDTFTIADVLQSAGYSTGVVGKWHLGLGDGNVDWNKQIKPGPQELGFQYHFLIPATGDRVPCVYVEQGRVVDLDPADPIEVSYGKRIDDSPSGAEVPEKLKQRWSHGHNQTIVNGISRIGWMTGGQKARWIDEDMADVLVTKARSFLKKQQKDQPFFLYFSSHDIHVPRVPHSRFAGKSGLGPRGDAMLQLDWCVGEILASLKENGFADNTLVIFTSDNGPVLDDGYYDDAVEKIGDHKPNGPLRAGKYSSFEGGTRVPMLVRWPGKVEAGSTSAALFGQVDLAATFAELSGGKIPDGAFQDSRVATATLLGKSQQGRHHLIHEAKSLSLRLGNWKFVPPSKTREGLGPWEIIQVKAPGALYELGEDLRESQDVGSQHPEQLEKMQSLLQSIRKQSDQKNLIGN